MKFILGLCLFALLSVPAMAGDPSWTEFDRLFGAPVQGSIVQKFVTDHALSRAAKGDSGSFSPRNQSYAVHFEKNQVNCVILHVGPWSKDYADSNWTGYDGELPFGLQRLFARKDVVGLLGENEVSSSNFWLVGDCELRISFSPSTGLIQEVYVWKKAKPVAKKPA